jgi:hypothetical protein
MAKRHVRDNLPVPGHVSHHASSAVIVVFEKNSMSFYCKPRLLVTQRRSFGVSALRYAAEKTHAVCEKGRLRFTRTRVNLMVIILLARRPGRRHEAEWLQQQT